MQSRTVCCCGAGTWALVIGWINTVVFGILTALGVAWSLMVFKTEGETTQITNTLFTTGNADWSRSQEMNNDRYWHLFGNLLAVGGYFLVPVIMGIVLITGVRKRNTCWVRLWVIVNAICFLCQLAAFCFRFIEFGQSEFISRAIWLVLEGFCLWVVNVHRKEMILEQTENVVDPEGSPVKNSVYISTVSQ